MFVRNIVFSFFFSFFRTGIFYLDDFNWRFFVRNSREYFETCSSAFSSSNRLREKIIRDVNFIRGNSKCDDER